MLSVRDCPFPAFGGKSAVADIVWDAIGDVDRWIEPFAFSAAVTLRRPRHHRPRLEVINDVNAFVANFWRATQIDPGAVADLCNWPVNECDLEARHKWLCESTRKREFVQRMKDDPSYYDVTIAAYWCWGLAAWIGSGWCKGEWFASNDARNNGTDINIADPERGGKLPHISDAGRGVHRQLPHISNAGTGVHRQRPHLADAGTGEVERRRSVLREWFGALRDRLRNVRVCCGDWRRVCDSHSTTLIHAKTCGVFLDPPYGAEAERVPNIYADDSLTVAADVREWCKEWGDVPGMRIVLCGYEGEHNDLESLGWGVHSWSTKGGMANTNKTEGKGKSNRHRERLWFSPGCGINTLF